MVLQDGGSSSSSSERWDSDFANLRRELDYRFDAIAQRFTGAESAVNAAYATAKEAVIKAELAQEKRFDMVAGKIDVLTTSMDKLAGKSAGGAVIVGYMIAAATLIISIIVFIVNSGAKP